MPGGEVFGILGASGAGKKTLINQIMGLTTPTSGSIVINGKNILNNIKYVREIKLFYLLLQYYRL